MCERSSAHRVRSHVHARQLPCHLRTSKTAQSLVFAWSLTSPVMKMHNSLIVTLQPWQHLHHRRLQSCTPRQCAQKRSHATATAQSRQHPDSVYRYPQVYLRALPQVRRERRLLLVWKHTFQWAQEQLRCHGRTGMFKSPTSGFIYRLLLRAQNQSENAAI